MFKKYFGFVAAAGVVGSLALVACTVETTTTGGAAGDAGPGTNPDAKANPDAKKTPVEAGAETCPNNNITAAAVKTALDDAMNFGPFKSAVANRTACSDADFVALFNALRPETGPGITTYEQLITKLTEISPTCSSCVFTPATAANWGPYITLMGMSGRIAFDNSQAAGQEAFGGTKACAQALHYFSQCEIIACNECTDGDTFEACGKEVSGAGGICRTEFGPGIQAACAGMSDQDAATAIEAQSTKAVAAMKTQIEFNARLVCGSLLP
jgi:hypothetical protein